MCWWPGALDPWSVEPEFRRYHSRSSSYRTIRGHCWNCQRVCDQLPCWNGHRIHIIEQISINNRVQSLGVPAQAWGIWFLFLCNLQAHSEATGWVSGNYSNQYWWGSMFDSNIITNVAWVDYVDASPANLPCISVIPRAAARRVHYDFFRLRRQERLQWRYNWHNTRFNCRGDDREGPVTQYFLFKIPVASVRNSFFTVTSTSNCFRIARSITLCVTPSRWFWFIIFGVIVFKSFNGYASSSDLSSFSLIKIAFAFSLCVLGVWLNISAVTLF